MGSKITRALRVNYSPSRHAPRTDPTLTRSVIRCMSITFSALVLFSVGFTRPLDQSQQTLPTYILLSTLCLVSMNSLNPIKMLLISNLLFIIFSLLIPSNCLLYQLVTLSFLSSFSSLACNYFLISNRSALLCSTLAYFYMSIIRVAQNFSSFLAADMEPTHTALITQGHHKLSIRLTLLFMACLCSMLVISAHVHVVRYKTTPISIAQQLQLVLNQKRLVLLLLGAAYCCLECLYSGGNTSFYSDSSQSFTYSFSIYQELLIICLSLGLGCSFSPVHSHMCRKYGIKRVLRLSCISMACLLFILSQILSYLNVVQNIFAASTLLFQICHSLMQICANLTFIVIFSFMLRSIVPTQRVNIACIWIIVCHRIGVQLSEVSRHYDTILWAVVFCTLAVHQACFKQYSTDEKSRIDREQIFAGN